MVVPPGKAVAAVAHSPTSRVVAELISRSRVEFYAHIKSYYSNA